MLGAMARFALGRHASEGFSRSLMARLFVGISNRRASINEV
jgi:hypothetical protein